ncbi:MAG: 5'/3'-nucleotidase SurE [Bacteroidales bacterium]|nr:5'/3'-nucleotidase SurE [Bacteroidales bacterium]
MENQEKRPLILISNDDGFSFSGIHTLIKVARRHADVVAVAPLHQQSGKGCSITFFEPLRAIKVADEEGYQAFTVPGTPVDCVKLAIDQLLGGRRPALVLSGINHGYNYGTCTLYSGTMGVTFEAALHHLPAVAFSAKPFDPKTDFSALEPWIEKVIEKVLAQGLPDGVCLNVNMPQEPRGMKVVRAAMGKWEKEYERRTDPRGMDYYWVTGNYVLDAPDDAETDVRAVAEGWVTVTPCRVDPTAHAHMAEITALLT